MKIRYSLLNVVFLLMFWAPASIFFYPFSKISLSSFPLDDAYTIHLLAILAVSFASFVLLSIVDITVNIWSRFNYWHRYLLLMGLYILVWFLIFFSADQIIRKFGIYTGCGGGSPLLMFILIIFYVPAGLFITFLSKLIKTSKEIYDEYRG
jgi:uncharacterized membrane protein YozB (DUF420 family)